MKTNGRRNAKRTKQQAKQQAKPSSRRMSKFPQQALHINKPVLNSNDVSSLIGDDPTITRREALVRFRRNVQIGRPIRTTPANMLKRAKLTATIPDAGSRQLTGPAATTGSRGEKRTNTNRTSLRARSSPSTGRSPIDSLEVTGMETIQRRITTRRRHVTAQAPSTPSVTNHVLPITIFTMMTIIIQVQRVTGISMSPFPLSIKRPTTRTEQSIQSTRWRTATSAPSQSPVPTQARKNANPLGSEDDIQMHATTEQSSPKPNRSKPKTTTANMHLTPQMGAQGQRRRTGNPTIGNFRHRKLLQALMSRSKGKRTQDKQSQGPFTSVDPTSLFPKEATSGNHAARSKNFHIIANRIRQNPPQRGAPRRGGRNSNSFDLVLLQPNRPRPAGPLMEPVMMRPNARRPKRTIINIHARHDMRIRPGMSFNLSN